MFTQYSAILILAFGSEACLSHAVPTHENMTAAAVRYLALVNSSTTCPTDLQNTLLIGAKDEDSGFRPVYHFAPPLSAAISQCSSLDWGLQSRTCNSLLYPLAHNTHTLVDAKAFAATGDSVSGLLQLGYVMHLLEDLTSPAHVRDDQHLNYPFTLSNIPISIPNPLNDIDPLEAVVRVPNAPPVSLGLVAVSTPEALFAELQKYTSDNFYSKDSVGIGVGPLPTGEDDDYFYDSSRRKIAYKGALYKSSVVNGESPQFSDATIDETVAAEQFEELGPIAVRYAASFLQHYLDETKTALTSCAPNSFVQPPRFLTALLRGVVATDTSCTPGVTSQVAFDSSGAVWGTGCFAGIVYATGSSYIFHQAGSAPYEIFNASLNVLHGPSKLIITNPKSGSGSITGGSYKTNVQPISIDKKNRAMEFLNYVYGKTCTAYYTDLTVSNSTIVKPNSYISHDGDVISLITPEGTVASGLLSDLLGEGFSFDEVHYDASNTGSGATGLSLSTGRMDLAGKIFQMSAYIAAIDDFSFSANFPVHESSGVRCTASP